MTSYSWMRLFSADGLKSRRSWLWPLAVLGPLGVLGLTALNYILRYEYLMGLDDDVWKTYYLQCFTLAVFVMQFGITLLASLLAGQEHQAGGWKLVLTLPVERVWVYLSKFFWLMVLMAFAVFLLTVGFVGLGVGLGLGRLGGSPPWSYVMGIGIFPFFASIPVMVFQWWLSLRVEHQAVPTAIGIGCASVAVFLVQSPVTSWLPWAYPFLVMPLPADPMMAPEKWIPVSLMVGIIMLLVGCADLVRTSGERGSGHGHATVQ